MVLKKNIAKTNDQPKVRLALKGIRTRDSLFLDELPDDKIFESFSEDPDIYDANYVPISNIRGNMIEMEEDLNTILKEKDLKGIREAIKEEEGRGKKGKKTRKKNKKGKKTRRKNKKGKKTRRRRR